MPLTPPHFRVPGPEVFFRKTIFVAFFLGQEDPVRGILKKRNDLPGLFRANPLDQKRCAPGSSVVQRLQLVVLFFLWLPTKMIFGEGVPFFVPVSLCSLSCSRVTEQLRSSPRETFGRVNKRGKASAALRPGLRHGEERLREAPAQSPIRCAPFLGLRDRIKGFFSPLM